MLWFFAMTNTIYALINAYGTYYYYKHDRVGAVLYGACGLVNSLVVSAILFGVIR